MSAQMETLVLLADGGRARGLAEHRRHGPLSEQADWAIEAPEADRRGHGKPGGTATQPGSGRSNVHDASPADAAEERFLRKLAANVERAATAGRFERLVLIAPPRALGLLRGALGSQASRRLEASEPHDWLAEGAAEIRAHLRDIRISA
jgi:protein required for attachment to host cells